MHGLVALMCNFNFHKIPLKVLTVNINLISQEHLKGLIILLKSLQ